MRMFYRILAYILAAEVVVQAGAMALAIAGLGKWVDDGGVFDSAVMQSDELAFPEVLGILVHGINGSIVVPVIALVFLIVSFFARVPGGVKWAAAVFALVFVQVTLGFFGHGIPFAGGLHGMNALAVFAAALHATRRARVTTPADTAAPAPVAAPV
jgi:hypothetical protein